MIYKTIYIEFINRINKETKLLDFSIIDNKTNYKFITLLEFQINKFNNKPNCSFIGFSNNKEFEINKLNQIKYKISSILPNIQILGNIEPLLINQEHLNDLHNLLFIYNDINDDNLIKLLDDLNKQIHLLEPIIANNTINPKIKVLFNNRDNKFIKITNNDQLSRTLVTNFGDLCIIYPYVGKPLHSLAIDKDDNIDQFRAWLLMNSNFSIYFYENNITEERIESINRKCSEYFNKHKQFFLSHGYNDYDNYDLKPGNIKIATLNNCFNKEELLKYLNDCELKRIVLK